MKSAEARKIRQSMRRDMREIYKGLVMFRPWYITKKRWDKIIQYIVKGI